MLSCSFFFNVSYILSLHKVQQACLVLLFQNFSLIHSYQNPVFTRRAWIVTWIPGIQRMVCAHGKPHKSRPLGTFGKWPSFMPKYGNFENWPVSLKPLPIEQK